MKAIVPGLPAVLGLELRLHPSMGLSDLQKLLFHAAFGADHLLRWASRDEGLFRASFAREWEHASRLPPGSLPLVQMVDPGGRIARIHLAAAAAAGLGYDALLEGIISQEPMHGTRSRAAALLRETAELAASGALPWIPEEILAVGVPESPPSHSAAYGQAHYRVVNDWRSLRLALPGGGPPTVAPG